MRTPRTPAGFGASRLSLRVKQTLWMVAIFLVVHLSLALVVLLYQSREIESLLNARMAGLARSITEVLSREPAPPTDARMAAMSAQQVLPNEFECSVRDERGNVIASSRRPELLFAPERLAAAWASAEPMPAILPPGTIPGASGGNPPVRAALIAFAGADGRRYLLTIGRVDTVGQQMHELVTRIVLMAVVIGVGATTLSAYIIAGIAVRPLADIGAMAKQLSPESIGQHVELPPGSPEVAAVERELELARQRLEAGFAVQERFMSNVTHELKTPIATVLIESQVLMSEALPPKFKDFLVSMNEELDRLARVVDSFLLLTRVRHGKMRINTRESCYVRDILVDSFASCAPMAAQHGVKLDLRLAEGEHLDAAVIGNCDLLRVIVDNIVRNAVRFSPKGASIDIRAEVRESDAYISIRDRGPGIPPELLPRIFDRFVQAKEEARRGRGHGLGLEIAIGIAEIHGGTITVRNHEEGGCEFLVRLPLVSFPTQSDFSPMFGASKARAT